MSTASSVGRRLPPSPWPLYFKNPQSPPVNHCFMPQFPPPQSARLGHLGWGNQPPSKLLPPECYPPGVPQPPPGPRSRAAQAASLCPSPHVRLPWAPPSWILRLRPALRSALPPVSAPRRAGRDRLPQSQSRCTAGSLGRGRRHLGTALPWGPPFWFPPSLGGEQRGSPGLGVHGGGDRAGL